MFRSIHVYNADRGKLIINRMGLNRVNAFTNYIKATLLENKWPPENDNEIVMSVDRQVMYEEYVY